MRNDRFDNFNSERDIPRRGGGAPFAANVPLL
jgi:hypothetical protein